MAHLPWDALLEDELFCDMHVISQDGQRIPAHKIILVSQSRTVQDAVRNHQPSEGEFVFQVEYSAVIVRQVVKALYTSNFQPLDETCISPKQDDDEQSVDQNEKESKRRYENHFLHQVAFCFEALRLLLDLRLTSGNLERQTYDTLETILKHRLSHLKFPKVVKSTLKRVDDPLSLGVPTYSAFGKKCQELHQVFGSGLLDRPAQLDALTNFLALKFVLAEAKLEEVKGEVQALKSTIAEAYAKN